MRGYVSNIKQLTNLMWLTTGIINSRSIVLSQLANLLPGDADAQSRETRIREWLKNPRVDVWVLYQAVLQRLLAKVDWSERRIYVAVDGTMLAGDRIQVIYLSLIHGNRAIPLTWTVVHGTGLVQSAVLQPMFERVAAFLSGYHGSVVLLADRGFRDHDWALLSCGLGWGYRIRLVGSINIRLKNGAFVQLAALAPRMGRTLCINNAILTKQFDFATHVSMTWSRGQLDTLPELVIIMSDERAHPQRLAEYSLRMDIEQSFRDDKSGGFAIDKTRLTHPERIERLLLAVAIATLWCHEVGQFVLHSGEWFRRMIDPAHSRKLSVFQIGLRWIKHCLAVLLTSLPHFYVCLKPFSLPPVTLSKT